MPGVNSAGTGTIGRAARRVKTTAVDLAGGPARARVALTLAAVLGVSGADTGTISSTADNLERAFHIGNTQIGLLLAVVSLAGAVFTLPAGVLTDRGSRTRLLAVSILAWAVAVVASGFAPSYSWLLVTRLVLGAVTASAGPAVASLTGDYFPAAERARIYGLILGGELVGAGLGYVVSGDLSAITTWRAAYWWLAVPSLVLAWVVWRLPEPARGGASRIPAGAAEVHGEEELSPHEQEAGAERPGGEGEGQEPGLAAEIAQQDQVAPQEELVLEEDPGGQSLWWVIKYVIRVRTNVVIIVASALGYFYFAGLRTFAVIFATGHYGITKPFATALIVVIGVGSLAGVFVGGRVADGLLQRGHLRARVIVPAVSLFALLPALAGALVVQSIAVALPLLVISAFLLGAPNPALDAARLDIMPPALWGRAEAVRTALRSLLEAAAPLLFGYVSQYVFGGPGSGAAESSTSSLANSGGLEYTFLLFLVTLLAAGLLALAGLRTYPHDVATAAASTEAIGRDQHA